MNTKKEKLLNDTYQSFIDQCLGRIKPDELNEILSEDAMGFGTTADEKIFGIEDFLKLLRIQKEQSEGLDMDWEIDTLSRYVNSDENLAVFADDLHLTVDVNGEKIKMYVRISIVLEYTNNKWIVIHWHGSKPEEVQSEEDTFGIENWKQKVEKLEKIVAERTADLVGKNRELEIEMTLERVRARTMSMQHSDELADTASILFQQIKGLGFETWSCGFCTWKENELVEVWMGADSGGLLPPMVIPYKKEPTHHDIYKASLTGTDSHENIWEGKALKKHYDFLRTLPSVASAIKQLEDAGLSLPIKQCYYIGFFKQGYLLLITKEPNAEMQDISKRFAKVFEQAYTRFLDLQKAEAQAREAEIELALERVRARTMAMQHSDELADASLLLDQQVRGLGIKTRGCAFNIYGEKESTEWFSSEMGTMPTYKTPRETVFLDYYEAGQKGEIFLTKEFAGKECVDWYNYLCTLPVMGDGLKQMIAAGGSFPTRQIDHVSFFKYGYLLFLTFEPVPEAHDIFKRFAKVFEQTYTRFLDLQKAEEQTREAQIEAALEKVRSRSLSMHKSDEIGEVAWTVVEKMQELKVELNGVSLVTFIPGSKDMQHWHVNPEVAGNSSTMLFPYFDNVIFNDCLEAKEKGMELFAKVYTKEQKDSYFNKAVVVSDFKYFPEELKKWVLDQPCLSFSFASQSHSGIFLEDYAGKIFSKEENDILIRFSRVFEQSYVRFLDLQKAEAQAEKAELDLIEIKSARKKAEDALRLLQQTQKQLIQSEKMASLGELTAGIAHEIQNPLNFVNNFSEVNKEMLVELNEEIDKGNYEDAKSIAKDVISNEEKINHHGKRADAIVKGMLQHSQSSSGKKEPTDINALCDEYLRLSYRGLRAKDKSFNATIKTDFDAPLEKINIIPQDIGRVLLNLYNNAFYAVAEKMKINLDNYEPTVSISTKKLNDEVQIIVKDNGNGIPQNIVDKIFQPFFTTKPTGQGTGLGLSLSYDIIKAHGGEIKVESKEGEGSTFIILIPAN
jgi:signal transduction histidine kinase